MWEADEQTANEELMLTNDPRLLMATAGGDLIWDDGTNQAPCKLNYYISLLKQDETNG